VTTQTQILELMRQLQQEDGMAIMLITHDLGVIAEMATDVAVMYLGRVVEQAPVDAIFHARSTRTPGPPALHSRMRARTRERLTPIAARSAPYDRPTVALPFALRRLHAERAITDAELAAGGDRHTVSCFLYE